MDNIFLILFLISFVCLIVGIINPKTFAKLGKGEPSRKRNSIIFTTTLIASFILFNLTTDVDKTSQTNNKALPTPAVPTKDIAKPEAIKPATEKKAAAQKYQIVHELTNKRYDGGKNLYVLIDPVDLKADSFKMDIKVISKKIISEKGNKTSIEFHDKKESLDLSYKQYGDMTLGRPMNDAELNERALHLIADYSGELETNLYLNTLMFFPGAFKDTPKVGKYVEAVEFDAAK